MNEARNFKMMKDTVQLLGATIKKRKSRRAGTLYDLEWISRGERLSKTFGNPNRVWNFLEGMIEGRASCGCPACQNRLDHTKKIEEKFTTINTKDLVAYFLLKKVPLREFRFLDKEKKKVEFVFDIGGDDSYKLLIDFQNSLINEFIAERIKLDRLIAGKAMEMNRGGKAK